MDPKVWGKHGWFFLHSVTMGFPDEPSEEDKHHYLQFFKLLEHVLPCDICKKHYKTITKRNPLTFSRLAHKKNIVEWLIQVHNEANIYAKKPTKNYDEVIELYKQIYNGEQEEDFPCKKPPTKKNIQYAKSIYQIMKWSIPILIILVFIYLLWLKKMNA